MGKYKSSKFTIPDIVKNSSVAASVISKLNTNKKAPYDISKVKTENISSSIKQRIRNNEDIVELFPDVELSIQIITSSVLSPLNMIDTTLKYLPPAINMPADIKNSAISMIKNYITDTYNIEDKLITIFRESYFTKGMYSEIIIPESSIDDIIHGDIGSGEVSVESFIESINRNKENKGLGILSSEDIKEISIESLIDIDDNKKISTINLTSEESDIDITENYNILLGKKIFIDKAEENIKNALNHTVSNEDLDNLFKINSDNKESKFIRVKQESETSRVSIDKPLVMKIQPESIIPVHVKNDPTKHLGYFVLVDEQGTLVSSNTYPGTLDNYMEDMVNNSKSAMIKKAKDALYGITKKDPKLENITEVYDTIVDEIITRKLNNGLYSGIAEIKENTDVYRTMFMRSLEGKKTKLLFLPKELVSYIAFDYRENGTGKSMLEKVAVLFSMRAVLLFSKIMANIKNSVSVTNVEATLDEDDNDPEETKEIIISEAIKSRQTMLPLGATNVHDLVDWSHRVGYRFNFDHPDLPKIEINTSEETADKAIPDDQLDEDIQEWIIMSLGLTADMVKDGYEPEFASTFLAKNLLFTKRVIGIQNTFNPMITDYISKLLINDPIIKDKLTKLFKSNIKKIKKSIKSSFTEDDDLNKILKDEEEILKYIVNKYLTSLTIKLPKPEVTEYTADKDAFSDRKDMIEEYVDIIFSSEALPEELVGEISEDIDNIKVIFRTILLKNWASENGYLPEVSDFLTFDEDGKPIVNILKEYKDYSKTLSDVLLPFIKENKKQVDALNDAKDKIDDGDDDAANDSGIDNGNDGDDGGSEDKIDDGDDDAVNDSGIDNDNDGDDGGSDDDIDSGDVDDDKTDDKSDDDKSSDGDDIDIDKL